MFFNGIIMKMKKSVKVIKRNGFEELYDSNKLCRSLNIIGTSESMIKNICNVVSSSMKSKVSTNDIFSKVRDLLYEYDPGLAALYGLERGLSILGPSGFMFEQYVASLFREMDYEVDTNVYLEGEGVSHEIDVIAKKGNVIFIVEAKYRNDFKTKTHINQIMYADARLQDIKRKAKNRGDNSEYYMWLITNTLFTDSAINYVKHRDMQLMGWSFPEYINLMKIVYEKKLYPVTTLSSITQTILKKMASEKLILVKDLKYYTIDDFVSKLKCSISLAKELNMEVNDLIG